MFSSGVPHTCELMYVWANAYLVTNPAVREDTQIQDTLGYTEEDRIYADYVETLWSNFAKFG